MAPQTFTVSLDSLKSYSSKTVLITGGSSGIGLATALLLHSLGNNVVVLDLSSPATNSLISSPRFLFQRCNITNWASQRAAFQAAINKFGSIDAVFVNAGIAEHEDQFFRDEFDGTGGLKEPDRRVLKIDMDAAADTVKLAIFWMRKGTDRKGKGGSIVMTASLAGYLASAGAGLYSAAKHGESIFMMMTKNLVIVWYTYKDMKSNVVIWQVSWVSCARSSTTLRKLELPSQLLLQESP
jgi:NAD(P)-dependent dehydrogenase (short-subunit alcohol dehydrogenase family)